MFDEDKIREMTRLAVFEKENGDKTEIASRYYKNDYVSYNMLWTSIAATLAYILIVGLFLFCNMEYFINNLQKIKISSVIVTLAVLYICFVIIFEIIAFFVYTKRYKLAEKKLKEYCNELKELEKIYNKEHLRQTRATLQRNMKLERVVSDDDFTGN